MSRRMTVFFGRARVIDPPYLHAIPIVLGALTSADGTRKRNGSRKKS